jgi:branched-chain amino acid transport system permease protein
MLNPQVKAVKSVEYFLLVSAVVFCVVGTALNDSFFLRLASEALIFGGLAMSVDLLLGIVGLLSLGQALYFGFGAYLSALILKEIAPSFGLAIVLVTLASALVGFLISFIALRSKGVYFALITFGLAQVAAKVVYNTRSLGASDGMMGVPVLQIWTPFGLIDSAQPGVFFILTLLVIGSLYAAAKYFLTTPMGSLWYAIRSNEGRLAYIGFVSPELMFFNISGNAVVTVVLGGVGTLIGPIFGSVLLTSFKSIIGTWTQHHHIVIGLIFVAIVVSAPKGLTGLLAKYYSKRQENNGGEQ